MICLKLHQFDVLYGENMYLGWPSPEQGSPWWVNGLLATAWKEAWPSGSWTSYDIDLSA